MPPTCSLLWSEFYPRNYYLLQNEGQNVYFKRLFTDPIQPLLTLALSLIMLCNKGDLFKR